MFSMYIPSSIPTHLHERPPPSLHDLTQLTSLHHAMGNGVRVSDTTSATLSRVSLPLAGYARDSLADRQTQARRKSRRPVRDCQRLDVVSSPRLLVPALLGSMLESHPILDRAGIAPKSHVLRNILAMPAWPTRSKASPWHSSMTSPVVEGLLANAERTLSKSCTSLTVWTL